MRAAPAITARVLLGIAAALLLTALAPALVGWRADVVLSGSMAPGLQPGDVVVSSPTSAADVPIGAVALVENPARPGTTLVHRVVARSADGALTTRGDANPVADAMPVPPTAVRALPRLSVPYVGLPALWWRTGNLRALALTLLAGTVLGALAARGRSPQLSHLGDPTADGKATASDPGGPDAARATPCGHRRGRRHGRYRGARRDWPGVARVVRRPPSAHLQRR
ncbi:signal peptidase I [Actinoplanes sp. NPDC051859]|uniref:signal peptidase I n=1 Tax=Actinoplanes sp. NPDC051859 TaxID=3363909 RepID=UPI0037B7CF4A